MFSKKPTLLTAEGLERLSKELEHLRTKGREEVAERLHQAFEDGQDDDFVDNAELEASRNAQAFLEGRIAELEEILNNYQLINEDMAPHDRVKLGDWVTVTEVGSNEKERYQLVGPLEADPVEGRISNESPLGKVLLGVKVGETVRVNAPRGVTEFQVLQVE
jgi:transcription elongation factor GreA